MTRRTHLPPLDDNPGSGAQSIFWLALVILALTLLVPMLWPQRSTQPSPPPGIAPPTSASPSQEQPVGQEGTSLPQAPARPLRADPRER